MDKKMKARVIKKDKKYVVEVDTGTKKLLIGRGEDGGFFEYLEWETRQDAVDYINSKEQLELEINLEIVK